MSENIGHRRSPRKGRPRKLEREAMPSREEEEQAVERALVLTPQEMARRDEWARYRREALMRGIVVSEDPPPHWMIDEREQDAPE